jgi:hypothetical protein
MTRAPYAGSASSWREFQEMARLEEDIETRAAQLDTLITTAQAGGRDLTKPEFDAALEHRSAMERAEGELAELRSPEHRSRQFGAEVSAEIARMQGRVETRGHSPLLVSQEHLRQHAEAIRTGGVFGAEEQLEIETRATVTVATDMGSPGAWGAGQIRPPTTLRAFAGIPNAQLTGRHQIVGELPLGPTQLRGQTSDQPVGVGQRVADDSDELLAETSPRTALSCTAAGTDSDIGSPSHRLRSEPSR